ncbi:MAG: hypothetical protein WD670_07925 [Actinomycetota bacterium]
MVEHVGHDVQVTLRLFGGRPVDRGVELFGGGPPLAASVVHLLAINELVRVEEIVNLANRVRPPPTDGVPKGNPQSKRNQLSTLGHDDRNGATSFRFAFAGGEGGESDPAWVVLDL